MRGPIFTILRRIAGLRDEQSGKYDLIPIGAADSAQRRQARGAAFIQ